ncbi:MAG: zinc ribbon domain-containing protein [Opitutaceae bacterium]|nr:zinc ribbon domain-containing protein [Opitutaceae bacterium]
MPEPAPSECANCGAAIPRGARACPECGADERTGWRENDATRYDGLDLPETAFEDEPAKKTAAPRWLWPLVGVLLLLALIATLVFGR